MTENIECKIKGCIHAPTRRFLVVKEGNTELTVWSCGLHDLKVYKELSFNYWPKGYTVIMKYIGGDKK